jgi:hypothetical protein
LRIAHCCSPTRTSKLSSSGVPSAVCRDLAQLRRKGARDIAPCMPQFYG